jgi:hypothetical protein
MSIRLDRLGMAPPPPLSFFWIKKIKKTIILSGIGGFKPWREHVEVVVNAINSHRNAAPPAQTLVEYFSSPPPVFPLTDRYYKYNVGDKVRVDLTPSQRQTLGFKYSMYYGMKRANAGQQGDGVL